jgi:hypothetical protein
MWAGDLIWLTRCARASIVFLFLGFGQSAVAQGTGCMLSPAKLSETAIKAFKDNPTELLAVHTGGGPTMSQHVRRLAGSDVSTVSQLIGLTKDANLAQVVAIGVGLAGASAICKLANSDLAKDIADQVNKAGIPALTSAFAVGMSTLDAAQLGTFVAPTEVAEITNSRVPEGGVVETKKAGPGGDPAPGEGQRLSALLFSSPGVSKTVNGSVSPTR